MALMTKNARSNAPDRIVVYGVEGVGKTTWAAQAPNPVFLCAEDGVRGLDVPKLLCPNGDEVRTFNDVKTALGALLDEPHDFKTLVIDTVDWLEPIIREHVVNMDCEGLEKNYNSFGRGQGFAMTHWRFLFAKGAMLDMLRHSRNMEIIVLAHAMLKTEESSSVGSDVKRFSLKLTDSPKASPSQLVKEWCDSLLFCQFEEVRKEEASGKIKGNPTGRRVMQTQRAMMWEAKSRWKLPLQLPMSYDAYLKARGVLSRLPELLLQAQAALGKLHAHPAIKEMEAEFAASRENETRLGALVSELEQLIANMPQEETF